MSLLFAQGIKQVFSNMNTVVLMFCEYLQFRVALWWMLTDEQMYKQTESWTPISCHAEAGMIKTL